MEKVSEQAQLNRRWRPALMSFFLRRVRDHAEAEDLTQEVFARLLRREDAAGQPIDAYVFQVAANLLTDRARRAKVRAEYRERIGMLEGRDLDLLDPHRIAAARAALAAVGAGLQELPERTRTIFTLYRIENMTLETIASGLGISASAAKQHVAKAMAHLMKRARNQL